MKNTTHKLLIIFFFTLSIIISSLYLIFFVQNIKSNTCESILQLPAGQGLESINFEQESNTTNKYISVEELRYLLHERNELKCRLIELEEELRLLELEKYVLSFFIILLLFLLLLREGGRFHHKPISLMQLLKSSERES